MKSGIIESSRNFKGLINRVLAKNITRILAIPGKKLEKKYIDAAKDTECAQLNVLREILAYAKDSEFGKRFDFAAIDSHEQYCHNVPIMDYEDLRPFVDRHIAGEQNVLFPGKPMLYTRTSGTTAEPKLIPITDYNFERTIRNRGKLWLYGLSQQYPGVFDGKDFTLVSPAEDGYTDDGVPFGALSGLMYKNIPEFVKRVHTIPYDVICIKDFTARAYTLLRFGVPQDVTCVFTGNPSTVVNLAEKADKWKEELIRDVADGTLRADIEIEPHIRRKVEALLEPAKHRAAQLAQLAGATPRLLPTDYWPNLKLVHTWTNGNCRLVIPELKEWFGQTPILDFGYIASEITATDLIDPKTNGSKLALRSGFYEFSSLDEGDAPRNFLMAHELEVGKKYYIYVTTYSGLYRYNMNDVIEVVDSYFQAPIIRFLYKGHGITSIQGEKLSESQLIEAVQRASKETGLRYGFFVAYADMPKSRYELYVELSGQQSMGAYAQFASSVDAHLCDVNIEYESKRSSQRLRPVKGIPLVSDAFLHFRSMRLDEGAFEGQLKWLHLSADKAMQARMKKLVCPSSALPCASDSSVVRVVR